MQATLSLFRDILEYELSAAERYRRHVSLVMIHSPLTCEGLKNMVETIIRKSDVVASSDDSVFVLMGETDQNDTLRAVSRYSDVLGPQLEARFSIATYPTDDSLADVLIESAQRRLRKATAGRVGHVVYTD